MRSRQQRARYDDRTGARQSERQRNQRPLAETRCDQAAIDQRPQRQPGDREGRPRLGPIRQREHVSGSPVAGIEIDEARAELVDRGPAGSDVRHLERRRDEPDRDGGIRRDSFVTTKKIGSR